MTQTTSSATSSGINRTKRQSKGATKLKKTSRRLREPLTQINISILRTILKHRLLTIDQVQRLCLPLTERHSLAGRVEYTRQLLHTLTRHKYLLRRQLIQSGQGRNPFVFTSTWKGAQAVGEAMDCVPQEIGYDANDHVITWSNENLFHLVAENNVYITFWQACATCAVDIREWRSDRHLFLTHRGKKVRYVGPHGGSYEKVLIPDGYYLFARPVSRGSKKGTILDHVTVEIDMGSQTLKQRQKTIKHPKRTWEHKVKAYLAYFQPNGVYEQLYGTTKGRVLTITTSRQRLENMKTVTESSGGNERFWFCTFEELNSHAIGKEPIFAVATKRKPFLLFENQVDLRV